MNRLEFYQRLAEILDVEEVRPDCVLRQMAVWDSLAILSVLALADSKYGVSLRPEEIRTAATADELGSLIEAKRAQQVH